MAYLGQFDNLIREQDRGHAIRFTRTIVVFHDGLAVCPIAVRGGSPVLQRGPISGVLWRGRRAGADGEQIRRSAEGMTAAAEFARSWPDAVALPFAVVRKVVLTRPRQVSELAIVAEAAAGGEPARLVYLGDLAPERVGELLGPVLHDRLEIDVAG